MVRRKRKTNKASTIKKRVTKGKAEKNQRLVSFLIILAAAILGWIFGSTFLAR